LWVADECFAGARPSTVEWYLLYVFMELDISSRRQLRLARAVAPIVVALWIIGISGVWIIVLPMCR
jgi:hypothetical protein